MPGVGSYTRETAGPMTWLAAVRALTHREVLWADVCHRYQAGWTASGCANDQHQSMDEASMLLCEAWEYILDAPEPTVFSMQCRRESLLRRIKEWGNKP